mmetsp:Transcript_41059/g.127956  ORF Transcript_41059/g.127956 Transcript_41059/m.127956 type:complete len:414 (+) Transcript_41059:366-1607(+)
METHVHETLDEELGGHPLQDLPAVPSHHPAVVHGLDHQPVAVQEGPAHRQRQERRLALRRPARRAVAPLDLHGAALHEPKVPAAVKTQDGDALLVLRQAPVEDAHVRVAPDHAGAPLGGGELDGGLQAEVGAAAAALGEEERELHGGARPEAERVQGHLALDGAVDTPEVNDQFPVHEHPDVIIAPEVEGLAAAVDKAAPQLKGEQEIVGLAVQRDGRVAPALAVDGEEARALVDVSALRGASQGQPHGHPLVDARDVAVPLVKVRLARQHGPPAVDGLAVRPKAGLHKSRGVAVEGLEVGVLRREVPRDRVEHDLLGRLLRQGGPPPERRLAALQQQVLPGGRAAAGARAAGGSVLRGVVAVLLGQGPHDGCGREKGARKRQHRGRSHGRSFLREECSAAEHRARPKGGEQS